MPDDTSNGPSDRFQFPPIEHAIWQEIADLLPEGHLKTYWEGLALIQTIPKNDPMIVAILAMGIVTISARQVPAEIAEVVKTIRELAPGNVVRGNPDSGQQTPTLVEIQLRNMKIEFTDARRELKELREQVRFAQRDMATFRGKLGESVGSEVEKVIATKSYFQSHPRAIMYVALGAMAMGVVLGFVLRGILS